MGKELVELQNNVGLINDLALFGAFFLACIGKKDPGARHGLLRKWFDDEIIVQSVVGHRKVVKVRKGLEIGNVARLALMR
ncbi:MAG: hypothetical protein UY81_C0009G0009 [Candidatus Giovannonibacteria bacterium GW2011_GWA2_53_7]|uniref:Uncharacterized protein n=1 Tax=Candidatus Giovannonibacteria bacterium GW2011_GWA2_53_7 TaxID=1618650 RepID=A0A0G2AVJ9_9BACT|nr:MAG: hypothetical protein UY81_C0009G0009 [Candidatus Giovannonibacteria bacterium GW2011_GWA2_53_7]